MASDVYRWDEAIVAQHELHLRWFDAGAAARLPGPDGKARPEVMLGTVRAPATPDTRSIPMIRRAGACSPPGDRGYEATVQGRYVDLTTKMAQPRLSFCRTARRPNYERLGLAFDGKRHGILVERRVSYRATRSLWHL